MWTLAFDTTTEFCLIALLKGDKPQSVFSSEMTFGQSEVLIPQIEVILKQNNLIMQDLNLLTVCVGPGSFTGVRSSLSAARAFGLALPNLKLCGVSSFDVYAHALTKDQISEKIAVIVETKREDFYVSYYNADLQNITVPHTAFYDDIIHELTEKNVTVTGNGAQRFLSKPNNLQIHAAVFDTHPNVISLAEIAIKRLKAQKLDFPKPLYLKAADVCVK